MENHHPKMNFLYAVCIDSSYKLLGFSTIQVFDFSFDSLENDWQNITKRIAYYARRFGIIPKQKPLRILNCGLPFVSGNHGVYLHPSSDKKKVLKKLIKTIHKYSIQEFQSNPIDIFIVKDFTKEDLVTTNELISLGYYAFNVEPNMTMKINSDWKTLADYLRALKTKFRVKAKKALELSKDLEIRDLNKDSIESELQEMTLLYKKVTSKAGFNLVDFELKSYNSLLVKLDDSYFVKTYRYKGKLVGFSSGVIHNNSLDAHFVGIDYSLNRKLAIYQRMLYDYILLGIEKKVSSLNFGRTASEIKSSVGAEPEHLTIYIRHKKSIKNKFLKLFLYRIQPSEFNQKFAFKKVVRE